MALGVADVRAIVDRVCARPDVLAACRARDLGTVISALCANGLSQGRISSLTGIPQGRLSEYKTGKRKALLAKTFQDFSDGLRLPPSARTAFGLAAEPAETALDTLAAGTGPPLATSYPATLAEAVSNVTRLWRDDLADDSAVQRARLAPQAWNDASLAWLVAAPSEEANDSGDGVRIGTADVDRFRMTVNVFDQLDERYGGGHARKALIQYLETDGERMLRGRHVGQVTREVYSAVGAATLLAAWMSYDSAPASGFAQRYFVQALAIAQAANDRLLGASILDAMSHQATHIGRYNDAANLARAARTGTVGVATPTQNAHFYAMEARALARLGDAKGCDRALSEAVRAFEHRNPAADPEWFQYVDETELSAEFGHCNRDLKRARDATEYAARGLSADPGSFGRSDFFVTMVLADAHLTTGDLEQGCDIAMHALTAGEAIRSARCVNYLREFRRHLNAAGKAVVLTDFNERARESRLWRIASRPDKGVSS
jgi:hypothetical protein